LYIEPIHNKFHSVDIFTQLIEVKNEKLLYLFLIIC